MVHVVRILPLAMLLVTAAIVVWRGFDDRSAKTKSKARKTGSRKP
jgi:hypothetical protein